MSEKAHKIQLHHWEKIVFIMILGIALLTRFSNLGVRAMSHDESLHTYYSYTYSTGAGYEHNPMMHGPFQFHALAATYQLLGVNDFTARIPAAICSVLAIGLIWLMRKELGKIGAFIAMMMTVISPFMLYYSRYVRNEAYLMPVAILTLWVIVRFYKTEDKQYLLWLTIVSAFNFIIKETAFFYTAQAMVFAGLVFLVRNDQRTWTTKKNKRNYYIGLFFACVVFLSAFAFSIIMRGAETINQIFLLIGAGFAFLAALFSLGLVKKDMGKKEFSKNPSISIMLNLGTLVLPMLSPLIVSALGKNPIAYEDPSSVLYSSIVIGALFIISFLFGLWWDLKSWVVNQLAFYSIFTVFYTSFFSNPDGFFTGLVGSLGYWLEQQGVSRGSQPWYYYLLVQLPVYEYLPYVGSFFAFGLLIFLMIKTNRQEKLQKNQFIFPLLLAFWSFSSLFMFSYAGEKMPWLTVHITIPMILFSAWATRHLIQGIDWHAFVLKKQNWRYPAFVTIALLSGLVLIGQFLGENRPFSGLRMEELEASYRFVFYVIVFGISVFGMAKSQGELNPKTRKQIPLLIFIFLLSLTTLRTSFTATFENYDRGNEYLVYAHSASGVKNLMDRVETISMQRMDGKSIPISFDGETSWPMTWYLRDYRNSQVFYMEEVDGEPILPEFMNPIVILGDNSYAGVTDQINKDYISLGYVRMVWPNQDYFDGLLTEKFFKQLPNPAYRAAFFDIWWNRDFTKYSSLNGYLIQETNWSPADTMRLYVKRDIAESLWNYGVVGKIVEPE